MSGNVFNRTDDEYEEEVEGDHFTVQYGGEVQVVELTPGMNVRDAFVSKADILGFDYNRSLRYRDSRGRSVNATDTPQANTLYLASAQHESKG